MLNGLVSEIVMVEYKHTFCKTYYLYLSFHSIKCKLFVMSLCLLLLNYATDINMIFTIDMTIFLDVRPRRSRVRYDSD